MPALKLLRCLTAAVLCIVVAVSAMAHHGWSSFDTRQAFFISGTLKSVRWGNPHSEAVLVVEKTQLPGDWSQRALPPGGNPTDGQATMASARPYAGKHKELTLVLAGPEWMKRWGLERPLTVGERIEAVGFLSTGGGDALRPVMFWLANGQGVWQQLTAFPRPPEPAPGRSR